MVFDLPHPPPANNLFLNVKHGRVKAPRYRAWLKEAGEALVQQHAEQRFSQISGRYHLYVSAQRPDKRKRDLGNIEKPLSDILVAHNVIEDDSLADIITLRWDGEGTRCRVEVVPA